MLIPSIVCAAEFSGRVVGAIDSYTIQILYNQRAEGICLNGIDYREKNEAYGREVKQAASELV